MQRRILFLIVGLASIGFGVSALSSESGLTVVTGVLLVVYGALVLLAIYMRIV